MEVTIFVKFYQGAGGGSGCVEETGPDLSLILKLEPIN